MSLAKYKQKRKFNETPEPAGKVKKASPRRLEFVIQKHHATQLHYDFRLELDGVLKSWAVPKGPSLNPKDQRLAMMVEDHPFEYRKFEGTIPKGNYGAGKVIIWDRGWYELDRQEDSWPATLQNGLKKGELKFILHGEKLNGSFALIKTPHMGENAWLLIKHKDKYAQDIDITEKNQSVVSGKDVEEIGEPSKALLDLKEIPKSVILKNVKPMLATLIKEDFDNPEWLYEIKWDGYRAIGTWDGKQPELYSRNSLDFSDRYTPIVEALRKLDHRIVLDGEVVALDSEGKSRFEYLQNWKSKPEGTLTYIVFDLLWLDGHDLRDQPLKFRKELLQKIIPNDSIIKYSDHVIGRGREFFAAAAKQKLEGIMAKNTNSLYREGVRSDQWLKIKTHLRQEVVIGGWTEPKGTRKYIGALLVGVYENNELVFVGHAGGLPIRELKKLLGRLKKIEQKSSPFSSAQKIKPNAPAHWVKPELVCEVSFAEWTSEGMVRQPIFIGWREDKPAKNVHKEIAKNPNIKDKDQPMKKSPRNSSSKLEFSHLDKIFFPESKFTKGDLIKYYQSVANKMFPYLKDRPHSLLRQPNGITGESFFQKDVDHMPPKWAKTKSIYSESNQKNINYLVCNSTDTLMYMVQLGCIEINPWNSRIQHLEKPDWIVMDLDPEAIGFDKVVEAAHAVHAVCEELEIPTYPKTSGKTGIHIFIPMQAKYTYDQSKQFGEILANLINDRVPDFTSIVRMPAKRQKKVYIDFLQNREGQTLAAPYSVRPTPQASVSTPLHWDEINKKLDPTKFTIKTTMKRMDEVGDLWKPVLGKGIDIKKVLDQLQ